MSNQNKEQLKEKPIQLKFNNSYIGLEIEGINYPVPSKVLGLFQKLNIQIQEQQLFNEFLLLEKDISVTDYELEFRAWVEKKNGNK